ncbi:acyl-CoA-binding domain-containing protein 4 isoform X2 [Mustelus asterias]
MVEIQSDCQIQFQAAVSVIQALPKNGTYRPSHEKMLKFYSYYKQATIGPCSISRPGFWDPIGRIKWDAWKALGNLSKNEAMMIYVEEIKQTAQEVIDKMSGTESAEQHFHLFEPLYEVVEDMPRPPGFSLKKVSGENVEAPLTSTPYIARNGVLKNHDSNMTSEEEGDQEQDVVTNRKADQFNENEVSQDGDSSNETHQANGIYPDDGGHLDPELGISQLDTSIEIVRSRQSLEHASQPHNTTDRSKSYTVEGADQNHFTSDSESEVFCDSVEELDHDKVLMISAVQRDRSVMECSQGPFSLQDTESTALLCNFNVSTSEPNSHLFIHGDLPQNHVTQLWAANGSGEIALDGRSCEKRKTTDTSPLSGSEWLTEEKGLQQVQGENSWRRRNSPGSNAETSERRGHQEKSVITLDDKIAGVIQHLQEDMQSVLQRLSKLEDLTASQVQTAGLQPPCLKTSGHKRTSRWLLSPSGRTLLFVVVWPFIAQWIVRVLLRRRRS